jgi:hypothetical protein
LNIQKTRESKSAPRDGRNIIVKQDAAVHKDQVNDVEHVLNFIDEDIAKGEDDEDYQEVSNHNKRANFQ